MTIIHSLLVNTHIAVGAVALVLFWIPVLAKKGSPTHVRSGKLYVTAMYIVSATAFAASILVLLDPVGIRRPGLEVDAEEYAQLAEIFRSFSLFLLMLSVLVYTSIRHGLVALRERSEPGILKSPLHRSLIITLGLLGIIVGFIGVERGALLLMIFGGISVFAAVSMFRESLPDRLSRNERLIAHLGGLLGSGIGAYTAFFAFGGSRLLADLLPGQWQVVSWIAAPVIGTIAINVLTRRYQRKPRQVAATSQQSA